jgi:hypothetical protein
MRNPGARPAPCKAHSAPFRHSGGSISFLEGWSGRRARGATPNRGHERGHGRSRAAGCTRLLSHCPGCGIRMWHGVSPHSVQSGCRKSRTDRWSLSSAFGGYGGSKMVQTQVASLARGGIERPPTRQFSLSASLRQNPTKEPQGLLLLQLGMGPSR